MAYPRVLLVDDDTHVTQSLVRTLARKCQLRVAVASSPTQALDYLDTGAVFDVLVCDQNLPGIKGTTLVALSLERWPAMRRVIYTGHYGHEEPLADAVLMKADSPGENAAKICELAYTPRREK